MTYTITFIIVNYYNTQNIEESSVPYWDDNYNKKFKKSEYTYF
jgi:hypothetical protein